jgi:hypothetical protein
MKKKAHRIGIVTEGYHAGKIVLVTMVSPLFNDCYRVYFSESQFKKGEDDYRLLFVAQVRIIGTV